MASASTTVCTIANVAEGSIVASASRNGEAIVILGPSGFKPTQYPIIPIQQLLATQLVLAHMPMINQEELRAALSGLSERLGIKGSVFIFLEGERVRMLGDFSLSALAPFIMSYLAKKAQ